MGERTALVVLVAALAAGAVAGCGSGRDGGTAGTTSPAVAAASVTVPPSVTEGAAPRSTTTVAATVTSEAEPSSRPLAGRTVVLDPGHNGANGAHPATINRLVAVGNGRKPCNTTGTESVLGLAESRFNWLVAVEARRALRELGATVVLTRHDDRGVGPCVDRRARIANRHRADAAVSIHADGGPPGGRGFHVILPGPVPRVAGHDRIVGRSARMGRALRSAFRRGTGTGYSTYLGRRGLDVRSDLGGLNLATVPAVMLESGNMRNPADARRMSDPAWRRRAGDAIAEGVRAFLGGA
ncbi:N-acetylmuramoyl-L-alanine amidase [Patulibacter defluvii]|uniref:N-acetylmuramoyl-L-alanine amidase n=1 Tax=Patulibacter defluvii TaxID=3095358 RepID=UPI002A75842B|nr:N-acetylmuramoyl-L-alanine amidase [Patulibacter sp. DM4]